MEKLTSLSVITARAQGETTTTIDLEARFIQSLEKVLQITLQHKAAWRTVRPKVSCTVCSRSNGNFFAQILGFVL